MKAAFMCEPSCVCGKFLRHSMNMQEEIHMSTDSLWMTGIISRVPPTGAAA